MCTAVRFGDFELDLRTRELRKRGMRVRIPDQSVEILVMLALRPNEIVTRDEIRERLWSDGTVVEFEHSISSAVARLREALGDSSATPRFIETVPRRGYRFIAPLQELSTPEQTVKAVPPQSYRHIRSLYVVAIAAALLIGGTVVVWWTGHSGLGQEPAVEVLTRDGGRSTDVALSPDGKVIVYASDRAGNGDLDLWTRRLDGGPPVRLTSDPVDEHEPAFSPDGAKIAFRSEKDGGGIYVMPALGGAATRLVALGRTPRYSPDGRWIAYWIGVGTGKDASQAYVVSTDGRTSRRVFSELPAAAAPVWSTSGRWIAAAQTAGARGEAWSAAFEPQSGATGQPQPMGFGRLEATLLLTTGLFTSIQWLPGDRSVVFSELSAGAANLYRVGLSGEPPHIQGAPRRLTFGSAKELPLQPLDGLIPFASVSLSFDLWEIKLDADRGEPLGTPRCIVAGWINDVPSLTTDGSRLSYISNRFQQGLPGLGGRFAVVLRDMASSREALLTSAGFNPLLSPDGRRLVYSGQNGIFSVPVVTLEDIRSPELVCQNCGKPYGFSNSGSKLIYRSRTGIDVLDFATGGTTHVIDALATLYSGAKISPDDRWLAFNEVRPGISQIWIAPFRSSAAPRSDWIAVSDANTWNDKPRWSPNGNLLYYTSDRDGFRCIWAQRLDPHKRPVGPPFALHHSHRARSCLLNVEPVYAGLEVARGKLIFVNGEITGDVWMLRLPRN